MVICWKRLFCGMHCFMISIYHAKSHFNDGTNERYHLLIHHKKLEQLKKIGGRNAAAIKIITKYKKSVSNIAITEKKRNKSGRSIFR